MYTEFSMSEGNPVIDPAETNDKNFKKFSHFIMGMTAEGFTILFKKVKFLLGSNGFKS